MISPSSALSDPDETVAQVIQIIQAKSPEAQRRIAVIAQIMRELLQRDTTDESVLAFTLVLAEISSD